MTLVKLFNAGGTSATAMMEIAQATSNYHHFTDIMKTIYSRLQESPGTNWRHNYKALQLIEFLIFNGSEQVVDNCRSHIYEIKAMQNYRYIDEKSKDQGANIRHRAEKILELLGSDDMIREGRQKAKENKSKYTGVSSNDMHSSSYSGASSNRYNGFGSDTPQPKSNFRDSAPISNNQAKITQATVEPTVKSKPVEHTVDLLDLGDFHAPVNAAPQLKSLENDFGTFSSAKNDDWADFTSAPSKETSKSNEFGDFVSASPNHNNFGDFTKAPTFQSSYPNNMNSNTAFNLIQPQSGPQFNKINDPLESLVSLDGPSLGTKGRKEVAGPSLNSLKSNDFRYPTK